MKNIALHFVFNTDTNKVKCFDGQGKAIVFNVHGIPVKFIEARENAVRDDYAFYGMCPPGTYCLDKPQHLNPPEESFGKYFILFIDYNGLWEQYGRSGIGWHGGGAGLLNPFKPYQGWVITHGCIRSQNADLQQAVDLIEKYWDKGNIYFTVA